jgi:ABC-type sugar transport system substrate-binding protein
MLAKWRSPIALLLALCLLSFGAVACGDDDEEGSSGSGSAEQASAGDSGPKTIAVNQYSREIPYFQEMLKGMQEKAKEFGWTIDATFANNDPQQQIDQVSNAITKQPDALVVIPIDEQAIVPPIRQAKEAGIPAITMGDNIAEEARDAQTAFIGVDYEELGKQKAEYIVEELGGEGTVGWIHGIRGLNFTEAQIDGATPVWEANEGINLIDGPYTGAFSSDKGLSATENLLSRERNMDAIMFDNDDIALGGIKALEGRNIKPDEVLTVGTDGGPAAIEAVRAGDLDMTISLCGFNQGKIAMDTLKALFDEGTQPEAEIITETEVFTPDNIEEEVKKVEAGDC